MEDHSEHAGHRSERNMKPYRMLGLMAAVSFAAMYVLMYAMVDRFENVLPNLNQFYMAAVMAAPMIVIELVLMRHMYPNARVNLAIGGVSLLVLAGAFFGIRYQVAISHDEFLRSMVPHHAGAILMCERSPATDADIRALCQGIVASQRAEIAQMKEMLAER